MARRKKDLSVTPDEKWTPLRRLLPIIWAYGVVSEIVGASEYGPARCLDTVADAVDKFWDKNGDEAKARIAIQYHRTLAEIYRDRSTGKIDQQGMRSLIMKCVVLPINTELKMFDFPPFSESIVDQLIISPDIFKQRGARKPRDQALLNLASIVRLKRSRAEDIASGRVRKYPVFAPVARRYNHILDSKLLAAILRHVFKMNPEQILAVQTALGEVPLNRTHISRTHS